MAKKKSTTTSEQTYNQTSTSTPTVAPWLASNYQGLGQQIADFSQTDPTKYVSGASDLQNQAFDQAGNLGGWQSLFGQAQQGAQNVMGAGANTAGAPALANATGAQNIMGALTSLAGVNSAGPAAQASAANASAASLLDGGGIGRYMNTGLNDLIDASLSDYDYGAGRQQAAARAAATANKAFNNDRSVFKETELADALSRGRASTSGQLRYDAFDRAAQLAAQDAAMRQQAALTNAAAQNQASLFNAGQTNQMGQFNAGQANQTNQFNAGQTNQTGQFNAGQANQANLFNTGQTNQISQFNAGQANQMSQFNAGQQDASLARQLQAAGLLGNLGSAMGDNERADLASQLAAGGVQQGLNQAQLNATPTFLQMLAGLNSSIPIGAFTGQTTTGSGNQSGTEKNSYTGFGFGFNPKTGFSFGGV